MLGGLLLCIGHSVLAIEHMTAFYTGLGFIVLGVGCLKVTFRHGWRPL